MNKDKRGQTGDFSEENKGVDQDRDLDKSKVRNIYQYNQRICKWIEVKAIKWYKKW